MLSPRPQLSSHHLDLNKAAQQCDLAILNSGHGATAQLLLSGKPILQLPLHLEQRLVSQATEKLGASLSASPCSVSDCLDQLLSRQHDYPAQSFAAKYAPFTAAKQRASILRHLHDLLAPVPLCTAA